MGELKWQLNLLGIRVGWYKYFSTFCIDRRNNFLQIGKLSFWLY